MKTPRPAILRVIVPETKELPAFRACLVKFKKNQHRQCGEQLLFAECKRLTNTYKTFGRLLKMGVPSDGMYLGVLYKSPLETYKGYAYVYFAVKNGVLLEIDNSIERIYEALES